MRGELVLGGLISAVFHLAVFLAPWTPMPRPMTSCIPKPELEISFWASVPKEEPSRQESTITPAAFRKDPEPFFPAQENLEPPVLKKEPHATARFSKPKVKPQPEGKKQEAEAQSNPAPRENVSGAQILADSSPAPGIYRSRSEEAPSGLAKGEKTGSTELPSTGVELPNPRLKKAFPRYETNPKPPYPEAARRRGYEGTVILSVVVLKDGSPGSVRIAKGSGYKMLDEAARDTVTSWKFVPARLGDEPVEMEVEVPILFRLE